MTTFKILIKYLFLTVTLTLLFSACKKSLRFDGSYFIFGTSFSECEGDCARYFLIEEKTLHADDFDVVPKKLKFKKTSLSNDKFELAKQLRDNFPDYLKDHPNVTFGCPDCGDGGAIYIERKVKGKNTVKWYIDMDKTQQPAEIREYIANLLAIKQQL